jgi:Ca2+/Na+ antiporter
MKVKGVLKIVLLVAAAVLIVWLPIILVVGVWIFLVWMVWKKKANIFHHQVELKLTERSLKRLKAFLLVAGISLVGGIVGIIVHNVLYGLSEIEEPVFFSIAIFSLVLFTIATIGSLVIFLQGRRKQDKEIPN